MKITMYELLGMVKDGKAPKKIKYNDYIYTVKGNAIERFVDYCSEEDEWCFNHYIKYENLNDEVEIIEEVPEKLPTWFSLEMSHNKEDNIEYANANFENMYEKINEICDYLKSKGE